LSAAKKRAKAIQCINNLKQIMLATKIYTDDHAGAIIPLWVEQGALGWSSWTYDPNSFIIQNPKLLWWPDKFRLEGYLRSPTIFDCPALTEPATDAAGGSQSTNHVLGLGMNYPEYGWVVPRAGIPLPVYTTSKENQVASPSQSIVFADSAEIDDSGEPDADNWHEVPGTGCAFFRVPSDAYYILRGDARSVPRHGRQVNAAFFDCHVLGERNSMIRYDLARTDGVNQWSRNYATSNP
jgi:prepilin-type processing-associated H-X9-DG protein